MRLGGFVKQSFVDWEGKTSAVIFTKGCNFRCGYCHNPSLVLPHLVAQTPDVGIDDVFDYLAVRKGWIDGVVVTGGEPTVHADLPDFLQQIKSLGYPVKLDTNGTNPAMLGQLLRSNLVSYVAMDIKTVPRVECYSGIVGVQDFEPVMPRILESVRLLKASSINVEFRTTRIPGVHTDETIAEIRIFLENCRHYSVNEYRDGDTVGLYIKQQPPWATLTLPK